MSADYRATVRASHGTEERYQGAGGIPKEIILYNLKETVTDAEYADSCSTKKGPFFKSLPSCKKFSGGADLSEPLSRVEGAGGKVLVPKTNIGEGMGYYALFIDSEGNRVGLHSMK